MQHILGIAFSRSNHSFDSVRITAIHFSLQITHTRSIISFATTLLSLGKSRALKMVWLKMLSADVVHENQVTRSPDTTWPQSQRGSDRLRMPRRARSGLIYARALVRLTRASH